MKNIDIITFLICSLAVVGIISLIFMLFLLLDNPFGPNGVQSRLGGLGYSFASNKDDLEVRNFLIDNIPGLTNCSTNRGCYANEIYLYISDNEFHLSGAQHYDPLYTLQYKNVQCSNLAYTYCYAPKTV